MDALECEARQPKLLCVALLCAGLVSCAVAESSRALLTPEALLGTWQLGLRPTPQAEPYFQELVVNAVTDDGFSGTFCGA